MFFRFLMLCVGIYTGIALPTALTPLFFLFGLFIDITLIPGLLLLLVEDLFGDRVQTQNRPFQVVLVIVSFQVLFVAPY